jgi:uncharacterized protein involved in exopolysaccharide biosynthesis
MDVAMNERQIISLRPYVDVLYRHRVSFLCALAVGLSLTAYALVMLPQGYRSSALLLEEPPEVAPSYIAPPARPNHPRLQPLSAPARRARTYR